MNERDETYLTHILECIERIIGYTSGGRDAFMDDVKSQDATIRNLQVLAESVKRLSDGLKVEHPDVEWPAIAGFRNILVHEYLEVDLNEVWQVIESDLPSLRTSIEDILTTD